ncbi:MAG: 6-carboxytetrahydropterin synthase QueD [Desulfobacterales bacterium]|jgi:6-pyruvoyltetrahydropterin/6-carboxytetrahydropterin synthase
MFELKVTTHFAAAHQLRMVAEKCENMHGHNWKVEVVVAGDRLNEAGVLVDFGELKAHVADIMSRLDHKYLNELDFFQDGNPSSENIAVYVARSLGEKLNGSGIRVDRVTAWESEGRSERRV